MLKKTVGGKGLLQTSADGNLLNVVFTVLLYLYDYELTLDCKWQFVYIETKFERVAEKEDENNQYQNLGHCHISSLRKLKKIETEVWII